MAIPERDGRAQFGDDGGGRRGRRHQAEPPDRLVFRLSRLAHGRDLGEEGDRVSPLTVSGRDAASFADLT
jgi:hypothetical protein